MSDYNLLVTKQQVLSMVLAISEMDRVAKLEGAQLDPPPGPIIRQLMGGLTDQMPLDHQVGLAVSHQTLSCLYATAMTVLDYDAVELPNVRADLEIWASCTKSCMNPIGVGRYTN